MVEIKRQNHSKWRKLMKIGTVKELLNHEYRVGLTPAAVLTYINAGHTVYVEKGAGVGASFTDEEYIKVGAEILDSAQAVYEACDMIVKVKHLLPQEYKFLREGLIIYSYFHLAADPQLTEELLKSGTTAVAYETIEDSNGGLPCLKPMSEIAGKLSIQQGAKYLEKPFGGRGILLAGTVGVERGKVMIIGGGISGTSAAKIAVGIGAEVKILDISLDRLTYLGDLFGNSLETLYSDEHNIQKNIQDSDLIIGAVLTPGAKAPKVIKKEYLKKMKPGAVIVDIAIDQGGCCESSKPTTHDDPTFVEEGVVHYCVSNMPGGVPRTSTIALCNATTSYGLKIANMGLEKACKKDKNFARGINTYKGHCTHKNLARSLELDYTNLFDLMEE